MPRFYLRLILMPFVLFTVLLLVIHAQPYDDHELRELLLPEGCPAPCFMGIRPGVTTVEEAVKILEANELVEKAEYQTGDPLIKIKWNSSRSIWLKNDSYGGSLVWIEKGLATSFRVNTNFELGDIQLSLGKPSFENASEGHLEGLVFLFYSAFYPDIGMLTDISIPCYADEQKKRITYKDTVVLEYVHTGNVTELPRSYENSWTDVLKMKCY